MRYRIDSVTNTLRPDASESEEDEKEAFKHTSQMGKANGTTVIEWDWAIEHKDRQKEKEADTRAIHDVRYPFDVDRRVLKDVVREQMGEEVGRIKFLNSGTFHKAYLVTLRHGQELVARVARRFMPRLKTESEVATMRYLQKNTFIPVPTIYHYDSNPYNRLGGEWILMSKAPGVPLAQVFHTMPHKQLVDLHDNLALLILSLFSHRFPQLGSLYFGKPPHADNNPAISQGATPNAVPSPYTAYPFSPTLAFSSLGESTPRPSSLFKRSSSFHSQEDVVHIGPIISWPFFGSNRGDLVHPSEINRGPWSSSQAYFDSCAKREVDGVIRENEGKAAPHKLHLDPAEIKASIHHHVKAVPGDTSDSDEWDLEESEEEWEGPGDAMYRDYRRMQRSTFLVAHLNKRQELVMAEMERWKALMDKLIHISGAYTAKEEFGLDAHDLSLENIFVDEVDHSKITCIIDWESTTTRPLWACAHVPACLDSSPFTADLFRQAIKRVASPLGNQNWPAEFRSLDMPALAREWLHWESIGTHLRMAHRFVEWDGWEEGLIDEILGPPEAEEEWLKLTQSRPSVINETGMNSTSGGGSPAGHIAPANKRQASMMNGAIPSKRGASSSLPFVANQKAKVSVLNTTGDYCGGRGGELGRRLEAWLHVSETKAPKVVASRKKWADEEYEAGAESD